MGKRQNAPQDIATPDWLVKLIAHHWGDFFDPCPLDATSDALADDFKWHKTNYVNPPYNNIPPWVRRAHEEAKRGNTTIMLIPSRQNIGYWVQFIEARAKVIPILGNVKFKGYKTHFPHALVLIVFAPNIPKRVMLEPTCIFRKIDVHRNAVKRRVMKESHAEHLEPQVCINGVNVGMRYWSEYVAGMTDEDAHDVDDAPDLTCFMCSKRHINRKFGAK
jgi:hypothetical protein